MTARSGAKILVIDDELEIRRLLRVALDAHDFVALEAETGREGVEKAAVESPDLVILDMGLPDVDGLEVIK